MKITRRDLFKYAGSIPIVSVFGSTSIASAQETTLTGKGFRRVRPSDPGWPSNAAWKELHDHLQGKLIKVSSPLVDCSKNPSSGSCDKLFKELKNPYFIGDDVALTESLGWVDAWTSQPSVYAVAAENANDVSAAVNFAREHSMRLVIKGGGHSYLGTSNAPDSLLIWTRRMNKITMHDNFIGQGCSGQVTPRPAVSVGAGAIWMPTYNTVVTGHGRYVQGGGCATVGVAGLIQSGGFGSFSKQYGTGAASLLEAEVVTADGKILVVNECRYPDLFWGLKGGGGGSLGAVTRLTLETHDLPKTFGAFFATVQASSDESFHRLIAKVMDFYAENLFNSHWGEQISFGPDNTVEFYMVFQGIEKSQVETLWKPFFGWIKDDPGMSIKTEPQVFALPARHFWDPATLKRIPGLVLSDDRSNASPDNIFWSGNLGETGQYLYAYHSAWLPATLLKKNHQKKMVDSFFAASRHFKMTLHCNKGMAGGNKKMIDRTRNTAMNPAVLDAFALVIIAQGGAPAYPGISGHEPDLKTARQDAKKIKEAIGEIYRIVPKEKAGAYVSESDYFDDDWQQSYWGANYPRLAAIKKKYDPDCLFFVHNGVGTEGWSTDGFTKLL